LKGGRRTYTTSVSSGIPKHLYEKYAPLIGSATAQQIINKNNEAWRSFLALKRLEAERKASRAHNKGFNA